MKTSTYLIALAGLILFVFSGCSNENLPVTPAFTSSQDTGFPAGKMLTTIPVEVGWAWRRIQVDGTLSTYGANNMNGDAGQQFLANGNTGDLNASFGEWMENSEGNTVPQGWEIHSKNESRRTYRAAGSTPGSPSMISAESVAQMASLYNIGETISAFDDILLSFKYVTKADRQVGLTVRLELFDNNGNPSFSAAKSFRLKPNDSWFDQNVAFTVGAGQHKNLRISVVHSASGLPVMIDDLRLYSSAHKMLPAAQVKVIQLGLPSTDCAGAEAPARCVDIQMTYGQQIKGEVQFWRFFYENPVDGMYYPLSDQSVFVDANDEKLEATLGLTELADKVLQSAGSLRIVACHQNGPDGYRHINETTAGTLYNSKEQAR